MAKIRICFAITKATSGGAQKYVWDLACNLPREQYELSLIAGLDGKLAEEMRSAGAQVTTLPSLDRDVNLFRDLASLFALIKYFRANKPDILHLNSPKMGFIGALAARLTGVKRIIYTSHGWPFLEPRSRLSKIFFQLLCWHLIKLSNYTIVISEAERAAVTRWALISNRLVTIYNGISETNHLSRSAARAQLNLPADALVVGTIAELHRNKGLTYLLTAAAALVQNHPQLHFAIIGEGEERHHLETLTHDYSLRNNIHLLGGKPEAATLLPAFDIFILPSVKEGLPYVILEAGLAGLPVVATRVGGIAEIIDHQQNGLLVTPANPNDLAEAIEQLIQNPAQRKTFGDRLRDKVKKNFTLEQMVSETRNLYQ
jgi:glycosyltransferase involved in cell wall biosynthesis